MSTLPEAVNTDDKPDTSDQTVVYVDAKSQLYVNGIMLPEAEVIAAVAGRHGDRHRPHGVPQGRP